MHDKIINPIRLIIAFFSIVAVGCTIGEGATYPFMVHIMIGVFIIIFLIGVSIKRPATALYLTLIYLPFMGLTRRYLMVSFGPLSLDPFVLISPVLVLLLGSFWFYRYLIAGNLNFQDTRLFGLVRWFVLIEALEVINPLQHGISVGLSGLMFYMVPLFWMVVSRIHLNHRWIKRIIHTVFVIGMIVGLYGLRQTYVGFFPFEKQWVSMVGYTALYVGDKLRAFSTPDNAQEYGVYLSIAIAIAWVYILRGRLLVKVIGLAGLGTMGFALFMESARGPIITTVVALGIVWMLSVKSTRGRIFVGMLAASVVGITFVMIGHMSVSPQNALVSHQVTGLTHPFNSQDSSLSGHSQRMWSGIVDGLKMPIGHGLGSTSIGAAKFSSISQGTEVDISNVFVGDGVAGGIIYILILLRCFYDCIKNLQWDPFIMLTTLGVLIAGAGQWLNGGLYSTSAITWVLIGYLDQRSAEIKTMGLEQSMVSYRVQRTRKHSMLTPTHL